MVNLEVLRGLTQTSTVLSMIGAGLVAFTWAYPVENRKKHGRILLLWLSVTDFLGSLFYFLQTFDLNEDSAFCRACASLDIFFPVASFIWTDFIAYYLFLVVRQRAESYRYDWSRLLFCFHVIAWTVSLVTMLLVILFDHAGRDSTNQDDDDGGAETAGWCWIQAHNAQERWIWELIGGKFIEWTSGLLIVPYLYISVAYQLYQIDRPQQDLAVEKNQFGDRMFRSQRGRPLQTPLLHPSKFNSGKSNDNNAPSESNSEFNGTIYSESHQISGVPADVRIVMQNNVIHDNESVESSQQSARDLENMPAEEHDLSYSRASSQYGAYIDEEDMEFSYSENQEELARNENGSRNSSNRQQKTVSPTMTAAASNAQTRAYFSRFYLKLFVLPIVFIFIRLWSSLRVILLAAGAVDASRNDFLQVMQAFFDPSQGFFNAVLFVFFSPEDRTRLWETMGRVSRHACIRCLGKERVENMVKALPRFPTSVSSVSLAALDQQQQHQHNNNDHSRNKSKSYNAHSEGDSSSSSVLSDSSDSEFGQGYRSKVPSQDAIAMRPTSTSPKPPSSSHTHHSHHAHDHTNTNTNTNTNTTTTKEQHPLGERRLTTSSEVIDIDDDFECNDADRLSNYSFDGRMDSNDSSNGNGTNNNHNGNNNGNLASLSSPIQASQLLPPHIQALQQMHQLQTLQAYSASRSASRSLSHSLASSSSPPPSSSTASSSMQRFGIGGGSSATPSVRSNTTNTDTADNHNNTSNNNDESAVKINVNNPMHASDHT